LNGVHLVPGNGKVRAESTDGHKLASVTRTVLSSPEARGFIFPRSAIKLIDALSRISPDDAITIAAGAKHAQVSVGRAAVVVNLIDGTFPDIGSVLPKLFGSSVTVSAAGLLAASRRATCAANQDSYPNGIKLSVNSGSVTVSREGFSFFSTEEIDGELSGSNFEIGFNAQYIKDFAALLGSDRLTIKVNSNYEPAGLCGGVNAEDRLILMPLRIDTGMRKKAA
jgi:DNA polymerase-3 subunit beta